MIMIEHNFILLANHWQLLGRDLQPVGLRSRTKTNMSTPTSPAETQRLAKLVRDRAGQENAAKAKAANRLISKCLIFIECLHPDPAEKRQAAQWFLQSVENAAKEDLHLAMAYAYNSYAGEKRTLGGTRNKRVRSSEVRVHRARVHLDCANCAGGPQGGLAMCWHR